jgi:hypothetical protein
MPLSGSSPVCEGESSKFLEWILGIEKGHVARRVRSASCPTEVEALWARVAWKPPLIRGGYARKRFGASVARSGGHVNANNSRANWRKMDGFKLVGIIPHSGRLWRTLAP